MKKHIPIILGLLLVVFALWLSIAPTPFARQVIDRLDNLGYDLQLRTHVLTLSHPPSSPVGIVDIDDVSLKAEGRWPWPRNKLAQLVAQLQQAGAAVIAFDVFFGEQEPNVGQEIIDFLAKKNELTPSIEQILKKNLSSLNNDIIFANSLSKISTVLALGFLPRPQTQNVLPLPLLVLSPTDREQLDLIVAKGFISNIPQLQEAAKYGGFINVFPDMDGIIRKAPLIIEYNEKLYPSLALQSVLLFLDEKVELVTPSYNKVKQLEGIKIGASTIPTNATGEVFIPFIGKSYTFPYYSATAILHGKIPKNELLGKILFIGTSATGLGDLKATSIDNTFPGVEVQATIANGLLINNFSFKPAWTFGANLVMTFALGLLAVFIFPHLGPRTLSAIIILFPLGMLLINNWIWEGTGFILSVLMPVILVLMIAILNMIYGYLFETRRREHLKEMFGQYVPEKHIDQMLKAKGGYGLGGEDRDMSVLFADIRNFTTISEGLSARELVEMLNTFFTPMTQIIFNHRGTIDKYVGDMIMAFWGAPLKDKYHARHALLSALEMQRQINKMRETVHITRWPEIKLGIGINSGTMSVGDMGSQFRRNYTVLGDNVNLASRIEGLTKHYGVEILVSESTTHDQPRFVFRMIDRVRVKGKTRAITIYELIGLREMLNEEMKEELTLYQHALNAYYAREWNKAEEGFKSLHEQHTHKKIYRIYLERLTEFKINPPDSDWDGVFVHTLK